MSSKKNQSADERFARVQKDPRFWEMPAKESKIKIDKRFQSMFHDKRFQVNYTVDKRGRPVNHSTKEDLKRFYNLSDSEEEEEGGNRKEKVAEGKKNKHKIKEEKSGKISKKGKAVEKQDALKEEQQIRGVRVVEEDDDDDDEEDGGGSGDGGGLEFGTYSGEEDDSEEEEGSDEEDDDEAESGSGAEEEESALDYDSDDSGPDLARGVGNVETSSDEDEEDEVNALLRREEDHLEHDWGELCKDAPRRDEESSRLAVCNIDWDRMKAKDLLALFNSFKPKGGVVLSVKIFPSEFGKQRMEQEQSRGPLELMKLPEDPDNDTEEEKIHREKLRDYQFKRLRYYYAVVECDSTQTAANIYQECDGFEYESSCSILDLRFIPDDMAFEDEPKDVATDVDLSVYTPKLFNSSATSTSKVEVTWDETDHERVTALNKRFNKDELLDMDFNAYLASSSEEEEEEGETEGRGDEEEEGEEEEGEEEEEEEEEAAAAEQREQLPVEEKKKKRKKKSGDQISRYRELLMGIQNREMQQNNKEMEMEVTWVPGLRETTEKLVKQKLEGCDQRTPWEDYLEKRRQKKKDKKAQRGQGAAESNLSDDEDLPPDVDFNDPFFSEELAGLKKKTAGKKKKKKGAEEERTAEEEEEMERQKAGMSLLMDEDEDEAKHKHFNFDKIVEQQNLSKKKKRKLQRRSEEPEEDYFQVDVADPRFQAVFTSHLFNLDPSDPNYKKTKGTQSILDEKQRRRESQQEAAGRQQEVRGQKRNVAAEASSKKGMDPGLSLLVKSIKNKTEQFQAKKRKLL